MKFLAVTTKKVVDQPFVPAQPEIPAVMDDTVDPPVEITPAVPAVPEQPLIEHDEVDNVYVENDAETVASVMARQADDPEFHPELTFYRIKFNAQLRPQIRRVREKARAPAPARTIVTIEDQDGEELGAAEVG